MISRKLYFNAVIFSSLPTEIFTRAILINSHASQPSACFPIRLCPWVCGKRSEVRASRDERRGSSRKPSSSCDLESCLYPSPSRPPCGTSSFFRRRNAGGGVRCRDALGHCPRFSSIKCGTAFFCCPNLYVKEMGRTSCFCFWQISKCLISRCAGAHE